MVVISALRKAGSKTAPNASFLTEEKISDMLQVNIASLRKLYGSSGKNKKQASSDTGKCIFLCLNWPVLFWGTISVICRKRYRRSFSGLEKNLESGNLVVEDQLFRKHGLMNKLSSTGKISDMLRNHGCHWKEAAADHICGSIEGSRNSFLLCRRDSHKVQEKLR